MSIVADIVAKVVAALLAYWSGERQRRESNEAREDLGATRAETETETVIAEIADERSKVPVGGSATDIAARLRSRRTARGPQYGDEPPAG
jgi:hypothetical protein